LLAPPASRLEREIVSALSNLSNHLLTNQASRTLAKAKARRPLLFSSPELVYRAMYLLNTRHYRLPVRRYVYEIFDVPLDVDSAKSIAEAGAGIGRRDPKLMANGEDADGITRPAGSLSSLGISKMVFSDDDEEDVAAVASSSESDFDEEPVVMPKLELDPALVVKGFVVA
jgi:rapamycin-insensitive companion of mTOR